MNTTPPIYRFIYSPFGEIRIQEILGKNIPMPFLWEGVMCTAEFHDIDEVYNGQNNRYCWRIIKKERVDGNETTPYISMERCNLGKTPDGQYIPVMGGTKSVTLPSNEQMIHDIGVACIKLSGIPYEPNGKTSKLSTK